MHECSSRVWEAWAQSGRGAYDVRNLHGVYRCDVRVRGRVPQTCPLSKGSGRHPPERHAKLSIVITFGVIGGRIKPSDRHYLQITYDRNAVITST